MDKKKLSAIGDGLKKAGKAVGNFFRKDTWLKIISLIFAIILWSYVIADENPTRLMSLKQVPVTYTGITELSEQGLTVEIEGLIHETDLKVSAGQDSHKNINTNNVKAYVDFSSISEPGSYTLDIQTTVSIGGASVSSMSPSSVKVVVEELAERTIPVDCQLQGQPREGCYVAEPKLAEKYIVISGPKSKVEKITKAVAIISVEGLGEDTSNSYTVQLQDIKGNAVELNPLSGEIPSVIVELDVLQIKTIRLDVEEIKNSITDVKDGYEVVNISLNSEEVEIVGEESLLAQIEALAIKSISAENADKGKILVAELQPIEGIKYLSGNNISFYAQIEEKTMEKHFENVAIQSVNLKDKLRVSMSATHTDITLKGGISVMSKIQRGDLVAYVDLAGHSAGTYVLPVKIEELAGVDSADIVIETASVTVVIE